MKVGQILTIAAPGCRYTPGMRDGMIDQLNVLPKRPTRSTPTCCNRRTPTCHQRDGRRGCACRYVGTATLAAIEHNHQGTRERAACREVND